MATQLDNDPLLSYKGEYFQHALPSYYRSVLKKFRTISRSFVHFNLLFVALFTVEVSLFLAFVPWLQSASLLALSLSLLFLTCFSYCVLLFYFQARKPEQLTSLKEEFIASCRALLSTPVGIAQHHLSMAETLCRLATYLHEFEWELYKVPSFLQWISPWVSRFSAYWYWEDVFEMKQLLLLSAIDEHIKQIRITPTDLEVHASLANTYVIISKLYRKPILQENHPKSHKLKSLQASFEDRALSYSRLAMEEFKILSQYATDDPWVHEQMAMGYKDLGLIEEEIQEMEILRKLKPQDKEILFRLGSLYFARGLNAKGLLIYEELKETNFKKAEDLISSYGRVGCYTARE
jgi:tetratricopeptide (TPR) repeat protein